MRGRLAASTYVCPSGEPDLHNPDNSCCSNEIIQFLLTTINHCLPSCFSFSFALLCLGQLGAFHIFVVCSQEFHLIVFDLRSLGYLDLFGNGQFKLVDFGSMSLGEVFVR